MYVYISENEKFTEFNDEKYLHWKLENIEYGNWYDGLNQDGQFTHSSQIALTPVNFLLLNTFYFYK